LNEIDSQIKFLFDPLRFQENLEAFFLGNKDGSCLPSEKDLRTLLMWKNLLVCNHEIISLPQNIKIK